VLLIGALIGALWFIVFVAAHVGTFASRPIQNRSGVILLLYGLALGCAVVSAILVPTDILPGLTPTSYRVVAVLAAVLVMACAFILYMPFYYTITTSLSVQSVIAIEEAPDQRMALADLASPAVYSQIVQGRLNSMVVAGNLTRDGDRYYATPKGQRVARFFATLKHLWRLGPGG
jgi:hypothetical protein